MTELQHVAAGPRQERKAQGDLFGQRIELLEQALRELVMENIRVKLEDLPPPGRRVDRVKRHCVMIPAPRLRFYAELLKGL